MYGMNGYGMPNGYPMMDPTQAYGHHMSGQMGSLGGYPGYMPSSATAQMQSQMTTGSYMNGSSSYSYSMAPYMQVNNNSVNPQDYS